MGGEQTPSIPTPSELGALNPVVAVFLLVVVGLAVVGVFFGPTLKDLVSRRRPAAPPDPPPESESDRGRHVQQPAGQTQAPVTTAVVERSDQITDRYIASLEKRIEQLEREVQQLRADNEELARQLNVRRRGGGYY